MKKIAIIGECMVELNGKPFGEMRQTFGGDTLNASVYTSRSIKDESQVSYVTALGADPLSRGMLERWQEEGVDTSLVLTDPERTVGAYLIQLDDEGERTFMYWRANSPASQIVKHPEFSSVKRTICEQYDMVFLSGISLAILSDEDRDIMLETLQEFKQAGLEIAFDSNFRPALWGEDNSKTRDFYGRMLDLTDLALVTFDDEEAIWGDESPEQTLSRLTDQHSIEKVVVKLGADGCLLGGTTVTPSVHITTNKVETVVDTTSAGDSFNGGFLAGYVAGQPLTECCRQGNALAGIIIQHPGAIIPKQFTSKVQ